MEAWMFFLGGIVVVGIAISIGVHKVRQKLRRFSNMAFGTDSILDGLQATDIEVQQTPKSLSGMDSTYLPMIRKDFPEFNVDVAKNHIKQELKKYLKDKQSVKIHNVVIRNYKKHEFESVIVMQASAEYIENSRKQQKRYDFNYIHALVGSLTDSNIAAVCPSCGGPISDTRLTNCEYCGARLVNIIERNWEVKDIVES